MILPIEQFLALVMIYFEKNESVRQTASDRPQTAVIRASINTSDQIAPAPV